MIKAYCTLAPLSESRPRLRRSFQFVNKVIHCAALLACAIIALALR